MKMAKPGTVVNPWNSKKGQSAYRFWRICIRHCYLYNNMLSDSFPFSVFAPFRPYAHHECLC